ncbi:MAG: hypothetical protein V1793_14765 [Pseudomonadota bacterium]
MIRRVVVAGWGQAIQKKKHSGTLTDALGLAARASVQAFETAGAMDTIASLDGLMMVRIMSSHFDAPDKTLARAIGANPRLSMVSRIGGNSPQALVNKAAGLIARGELDTVLIAGGETYYPRTGSGNTLGEKLLFQGVDEADHGDDTIGSTPLEASHGLTLPIHGFPLFETALWAASGLSLDQYRMDIANLWSGFSQVAATHPFAWTDQPRTPGDIAKPTPANRWICFPYTKYMNPCVTVDLGAAVLLMSEEKARQLSCPVGRPVYFRAGGFAQDRQRFLIEKTNFVSSPPLKAAVEKALTRSGLSLEEINCFDLYSCFPCAVSMARRMTGIQNLDPRPLTLTGGLGFFGGPGNNYSLHAIATLAESIASGKRENGMVTSLGWFMHKHAAGIYSALPGANAPESWDLEDDNDFLVGGTPVPVDPRPTGSGTIETYTVDFSHRDEPPHGILYGRTRGDRRFISVSDDPETIAALIRENQVGRQVKLRPGKAHDTTLATLA